MSTDNGWAEEVAGLRASLDALHRAREEALRQCRSVIQGSSKCIRHVHRRQFHEASAMLDEVKAMAAGARASLSGHPELLYAGYLQDAEKEMVEAAALLAWVAPSERRASTPSVAELGVGPATYLNGLGEAASECRRYLLDELRRGDLAEAERLLSQMETVYDDLITFDYPDVLTGGLRRTCDALRAVIERTRSDVTMTCVQRELTDELRRSRGQ